MKKYILLSLMGVTLASCSLDDNINPNKAAGEGVSPELRLSGAMTTSYSTLAGSMNGLGNAWTNAWSGNFAQFGNPFTTEADLNITTTYRQSIFNDTYKAVTRFQRIIDFDHATYPNYVAIAEIQKAFYMQYMVDLYGDVPYSEAFQEVDNITPKYDKGVDVYKGLVGELLDAKKLISTYGENPAYLVTNTSDPVFEGDMGQWEKFANTVLLKYAVRLSNTTDSEGIALKNEIISALAGADYITENVTINPGYNNGSAAGQNPLYYNFGRGTYDGQINTQGYQLMTASDHAVRTLQGDAAITSGVSDSRIEFLFTPAKQYNGTAAGGAAGYYGYPQGMGNEAYKASLGFGPDDLKPTNGNFSFLGGSFYAFPDGAYEDGYLMMLAESEFLQAEAALRGYAGFGDAQAHFQAGIQASFEFDGQADAAADYITAIAGKPKAGWTGSNEDKIAAIQYQRWVALMNYNGIESYINYLRTGYPETPLATTATQSNKPYRLLYPANEYATNSANVPQVSQAQCFTKNEFTPFIYR